MSIEPAAAVSPQIRRLVTLLAEGAGPARLAILEQVDAARVHRSSATMLDVEVPQTCTPIPVPNGPLPVTAVVVDGAGTEVGELLLWIRDGRWIGLEQAWFTDEPPASWPDPALVRLS